MPSKSPSSKSVSSLKHKDKRVNIPTKELRGFVEQDENAPKTVEYPGLLYARDPSLDPQLVWKGKDEQDLKPLEVPAVPVYIQEKIHPQAIVEQVRAEAKKETPRQAELFADFNGIKFEEMVDFYRHEQNWSNRMILGDSLLVMTSLSEKEGLKGKVQMIYIDPPYGIKFGSNWQVSTRKRDVKDGKAEDLTRQPEQIRAFRDTWEYGIHSYLSYLRDRLVVARDLLTESGSVFVQIGDENVHLVRCLMDEVFGVENFVNQIGFQKSSGRVSETVDAVFDTLLWYGRDKERLKFRMIFRGRTAQQVDTSYNTIELEDGAVRGLTAAEADGESKIPSGARRFRPSQLYSQTPSASSLFSLEFQGQQYGPSAGAGWRTSQEGLVRLSAAARILPRGKYVAYKLMEGDFPYVQYHNIWTDTLFTEFGSGKTYVVQTAPRVIERCMLMTTDPGDLVLDPTSGSGTTAYVAEQWGRRWITIDTSRVAIALARTRLIAGKFPYYTLSDSPEGLGKEAELAGSVPPDIKTDGDIRKGFVYQRVPHVTLKSIANNEEIDAIHAKWQPRLEQILGQLNVTLTPTLWSREREKRYPSPQPSRGEGASEAAVPSPLRGEGKGEGEQLREWEVPREADQSWPEKAKKLLADWWKLRRARQQEIDASIARLADTELLYDKPYEDSKRIRVTGPFTVESLSPHRVLPGSTIAAGKPLPQEKRKSAPAESVQSVKSVAESESGISFVHLILDNLRKAGVQNTIRNERLKFDRLDPYAGVWLHASGEYSDKDGKPHKVAVSIGPEHGTVGPEQVKEAAKEAVQGVGFDLLIVCGFAFDPHVSEETKRYGKLTVLACRMNPDLAMGDELLKKTGAGNLFMVFGEPDVEVKKKDGKLTVEIKGLDVYDPTTGEIRNSTTDDIACWFIDTNYNGESFFVRHAYFTGADQPYDKLKRALRAEVNEAAWSALYSTRSTPFDPPKTGKIAVKVINHYGDEVLKVLEP